MITNFLSKIVNWKRRVNQTNKPPHPTKKELPSSYTRVSISGSKKILASYKETLSRRAERITLANTINHAESPLLSKTKKIMQANYSHEERTRLETRSIAIKNDTIDIFIKNIENSLAQARRNIDYHSLEPNKLNQWHINKEIAIQSCPLLIKKIADCELGIAWSSNIVNTAIFRHHGILTYKQFQYTAFYLNKTTLRIIQRNLLTEIIINFDLIGTYEIQDAHNSISLGVDRNGHIHLSYDHHVSSLHYRRSLNPEDISAWTDEVAMTGVSEDKFTYPTFILPQDDMPLTLLYRDGFHDKGDARIKTYNESTKSWVDNPEVILSGSENRPWTSNAYWNHPARGKNGEIHLSFVWRTHPLGSEEIINNINICYAHTKDNGLTWETSLKQKYKLPITQVNVETIHPVSPGNNLINQSSMALDSFGYPHIAFYANDENGIPQYQHLWFNGNKWKNQVISNRSEAFILCGRGTLKIPISRPEIIIDKKNNAYVLTRTNENNNSLLITKLPYPDYPYLRENTEIIIDECMGSAEPIIDRARWCNHNILSVLFQYNNQGHNDELEDFTFHKIRIIDFKFD